MAGKVFLTGDTHIPIDISKLKKSKFKEQKELDKDDFLIVLGDFGLIWQYEPDNTEKYWTEVLNNKNFTTLFVDGNHENHKRLNSMPVETWHGGKVHKITDSIIHLMRGQVFEIHGHTYFTFGGAASTDKQLRIRDKSWWEEEICNFQEQEEAFANLEKYNNKVDYVLSHTCPSDLLPTMFQYRIYRDTTGSFLNMISKEIKFNHWFFGHFHENKTMDKFTCLYNEIQDLDS